MFLALDRKDCPRGSIKLFEEVMVFMATRIMLVHGMTFYLHSKHF